jgi:hypothetical protein
MVSIDTVYQRVLAILNKEQRGYLPPMEFNLFANQAQMDLFEQYFYDINQFGRLHGNDTEYSDMLTILNEKINLFEKNAVMTWNGTHWIQPTDLYRIGSLLYNNIEVERINANEYRYIAASPLAKPTDDRPIFVANSSGYKVYGDNEIQTAGVSCNYIKVPAKVDWAYIDVLGVAEYNITNTVNFELHPSEETELVFKILELAGLAIKDISVYQAAMQMDAQNTQQEKS